MASKAQIRKLRDYCDRHGVTVAQRKADGLYCLLLGYVELDVTGRTLGELANKLQG